jgi:DNA-directed RNA polymerase subunit RPC12/RpoP
MSCHPNGGGSPTVLIEDEGLRRSRARIREFFRIEPRWIHVTDPDTDPYTAYYEFDPVLAASDGRHSTRERADVLHELGLAGSPCRERRWGTKVEVRCPGCGTTGKVVAWDGTENVYACADCDAAFAVPGVGSDERSGPPGERPAGRATVRS